MKTSNNASIPTLLKAVKSGNAASIEMLTEKSYQLFDEITFASAGLRVADNGDVLVGNLEDIEPELWVDDKGENGKEASDDTDEGKFVRIPKEQAKSLLASCPTARDLLCEVMKLRK